MKIAALPWYNFTQSRHTLDLIWRSVQSQLTESGYQHIPLDLDHSTPHQELWTSSNLLLSQCCGLDLYRDETAALETVGAPVVTTLDVAPGYYFSHIVARPAQQWVDTPTIAINNWHSHSGHTALKAWLETNGLNATASLETGSHSQSANAVRAGHADLAAIDALSWQFIDTSGLVIIGASEPVPAPPFVTSIHSRVAKTDLLSALHLAIQQHGPTIGLSDVMPISKRDYAEVKQQAVHFGILQ
jgi:ABC-type phosphate/phosphonate transport system substrate-binding protein